MTKPCAATQDMAKLREALRELQAENHRLVGLCVQILDIDTGDVMMAKQIAAEGLVRST